LTTAKTITSPMAKSVSGAHGIELCPPFDGLRIAAFGKYASGRFLRCARERPDDCYKSEEHQPECGFGADASGPVSTGHCGSFGIDASSFRLHYLADASDDACSRHVARRPRASRWRLMLAATIRLASGV
jgi:hypothetical protein